MCVTVCCVLFVCVCVVCLCVFVCVCVCVCSVTTSALTQASNWLAVQTSIAIEVGLVLKTSNVSTFHCNFTPITTIIIFMSLQTDVGLLGNVSKLITYWKVTSNFLLLS